MSILAELQLRYLTFDEHPESYVFVYICLCNKDNSDGDSLRDRDKRKRRVISISSFSASKALFTVLPVLFTLLLLVIYL